MTTDKSRQIYRITETYTDWGRQMVDEYGDLVQLAATTKEGEMRFVHPDDHPWDFQKWSYWASQRDMKVEKVST